MIRREWWLRLIPKRIIYCWFGGKPKPEKIQDIMKTWAELLPDWEILEINENNFDIHMNKYVEDAYNNKAWAFVSDVARLWALYTYGGIYMDTDVRVYKPLDKFLSHGFFTGFENTHYPVTATMGAIKNHWLIKELLEIYDNKVFKTHDEWGKYETNTMIMSDIIGKYINRDRNEYQTYNDVAVYPRETFCGFTQMNDNVYTEHCMFGSWFDK